MIEGLRPYPEYRDSGVGSLGKIPAHWDVRRLRHVAEMRVSNIDKHSAPNEKPVRLCNYVDVYKNERITESLKFMRASASESEIDRFRLKKGDVVITKDSEAWTDIGVPALVEYEAEDLVCGYHLAILRPRSRSLDGGYLLRALQSQGVAIQFHVSANGVTRYGLSHGAIKNILLPVPTPPEQASIVRYLDHVNRRIRRLMRAKQMLIDLLNEQQQVIIQRTITRGLDPYVRYKSAGVPWLDEIPEHWERRRIGQLASVFNGSTPSRSQPAYWNGGLIPWLSSSKVNDNIVETASELITELALKECSIPVVPEGAVIIGLVGQGRTRGMSARLKIEACINQNLAAIIPRQGLDSEYLHLYLTGIYKFLREYGRGGNQEALNCEIVRRVPLALPPLDEQRVICSHVRDEIRGVVDTAGRVKREIALFAEYRTRLIADVVTGQIDVREAARQLPGEIDGESTEFDAYDTDEDEEGNPDLTEAEVDV